jgi:hypothetical protein
MPEPLAAGIIMHEMNERRNLSVEFKNFAGAQRQGQFITDAAKKKGEAYFAAFKRQYDGDKRFQLVFDNGKPLVELEFDLRIPGTTHYIIGRFDEVLSYNKLLWVGDTKTANEKSTEVKKKIEFGFSSQPLFYINAARMLGYDVAGMLYRVVTAHVPAKHWVIESKRTEYQLLRGLRSIAATASLIEFYREKFGIDEPWPHLATSYPCNYNNPRTGELQCEYADICNRSRSELSTEDLEKFVPRIEHLDLLKGKSK